MKIYTTNNKLFGAISMLFLENEKDIDEDGVYIIPSSIHEVILLPKKMCESEEYINNVISEVNNSSVEKQEVLSEHAYYYNKSDGYRIVWYFCIFMVISSGMWVSLRDASVAQGIEQRFPVPRVGGSNPLGCAGNYINYKGY